MKVVYYMRENHLPSRHVNIAHCFYIPDKKVLLVSEKPLEEDRKWRNFSVQTFDYHEPFRWMELMEILEEREPTMLPDVSFSDRNKFNYDEARIVKLIADTPRWKELGEKVPLEFDALRSRLYGQQKR